MTGKFVNIVRDRNFGFIRSDGKDYFFRFGDVLGKQKYIYKGNTVTFDEAESYGRNPQAVNIFPETTTQDIIWHSDELPNRGGWYWGIMERDSEKAYPVYYCGSSREWFTITDGEYVYAYPILWGIMRYPYRDD